MKKKTEENNLDCTCKICQQKKFVEILQTAVGVFGLDCINYKHPKMKRLAKYLKKYNGNRI